MALYHFANSTSCLKSTYLLPQALHSVTQLASTFHSHISARYYAEGPLWRTTSVTGVGIKASTEVQTGDKKTFLVDEPVNLGGRGEGANPLNHFLGSLVGCSQYLLHVVATERKVPIEKVFWKATSRFDLNGVRGKPDASPHLTDFEVVGEVETSADQKVLDEVADAVENRCIVAATVKKTGQPYNFKLIKKA